MSKIEFAKSEIFLEASMDHGLLYWNKWFLYQYATQYFLPIFLRNI